jgi:hypothetical protein
MVMNTEIQGQKPRWDTNIHTYIPQEHYILLLKILETELRNFVCKILYSFLRADPGVVAVLL